MFVQDGFLYLIVTRHKLTVRGKKGRDSQSLEKIYCKKFRICFVCGINNVEILKGLSHEIRPSK